VRGGRRPAVRGRYRLVEGKVELLEISVRAVVDLVVEACEADLSSAQIAPRCRTTSLAAAPIAPVSSGGNGKVANEALV
jgi:hypothetical protein